MWIRNLCVFLGSEPFAWSPAELETKLTDALCPECAAQSTGTQGFVPPVKGDVAMVHVVDGVAICLHQEISRVLPGAVLAAEVDERVDRIEAGEGRKVSRRERADIRDQAHFELLPRAFTRARRTPVFIDLHNHQVWVDASSEKRAETVVGSLRDALGSLPVTRPAGNIAPAAEMSLWLDEPERLPAGFAPGDRAVLESTDEARASVRVTAMDVQRDEVRAHLAAGMQVVRLNLAMDDAIEFDLDESLDLKRIRALDVIQEDLDALETEDAVAELQARVSIQAQPLRDLIARLYGHFGALSADASRAA